MPDYGNNLPAGRAPVNLSKIRLRVMAWTGIPQMQMERLRKRDVDFIGNRICLQPRRKGKGVEGVWLPLSPPAVEAFRAYAAADLWEQPFSRKGLWITWRRTLARTRRQVEAAARTANDPALLEAFDAAIPPGCRPYDLRHSFLTEAYASSGDHRAVSELAQHSSLETTKRYTRGAVSTRTAAVVAAMAAKWEQERLDALAVTPAPALRLVKPQVG
jgi:integrase